MKRLGTHQLCLLATLASPFSALIVTDRVAASLVKRRLLSPHFAASKGVGSGRDSFFGITPAGLRVLADAYEGGALERFLDPKFQRDRTRITFSTRARDLKARKD